MASKARRGKAGRRAGAVKVPRGGWGASTRQAPPVRTVGLVGHRSSGKTTVAEHLLLAGGALRAAGQVEEGTTLLDHTPEERRRRMSLWPAYGWLPWGDSEVYVVDTPGLDVSRYARRLALQGTDLLLVCIEARPGLPVDVCQLLREAKHDPRRTVVVVTKCTADTGADQLLSEISEASACRAVPLTLPFLDEEGTLAGVIDVLGGEVLRYAADGTCAYSSEPLPAAAMGAADAAREQVQEAAAMADDALLETYLEFLELPNESVWTGLVAAMDLGSAVPVVFTAAAEGIGMAPLLDALLRLAPDPKGFQPPAPLRAEAPSPGFVGQWVGSGLDEDGALYRVVRVWSGEPPRGAWRHASTGAEARVHKLYRLRGPRRAQAKHTVPGTLLATWDDLPGKPGDVFTDGPPVIWHTPPPPPEMSWLRATGGPELSGALQVACAMDPSLRVHTLAAGSGDEVKVRLAAPSRADLDAALRLMRDRFGCQVVAALPEAADAVSVSETIDGVVGPSCDR